MPLCNFSQLPVFLGVFNRVECSLSWHFYLTFVLRTIASVCTIRFIDKSKQNFGKISLHYYGAVFLYRLIFGFLLNLSVFCRPLHEAVDCNSTEMVRLLLSAGADINLATYSGKSVHDVAHNPSMKEFLKGSYG